MTLNEYRLFRVAVFFSVFCALILSFLVFTTNAEAATEEVPWIDVLQYGGVVQSDYDEYGTSTYFSPKPGKSTTRFKLPRLMAVKYVDMVIYTGGGWWPAGLTIGAWNNTLSVYRYGPYENFWRVYGPVTTSNAQVASVEINVNNPTSSSLYFDVLECRVSSTVPYTDVNSTWKIVGTNITDSGSFPGSATQTDWYSPINASNEVGELTITIPYSQWLRYDHIDIAMMLDVSGITSISATTGNYNGHIPIETSYLGSLGYSEENHLVQLSLDLTGVQAEGVSLHITIDFNDWPGSSNYFNLLSVHGWSTTSVLTDVSFWGTIIAEILNEKLDILASGNLDQGSIDVQDNIAYQNEGIKQDMAVLDSVERPDISNINMPSAYLSDINYTGNTTHLSILLQAQPFRLIFMLAALFMLIAVVLHGRRN